METTHDKATDNKFMSAPVALQLNEPETIFDTSTTVEFLREIPEEIKNIFRSEDKTFEEISSILNELNLTAREFTETIRSCTITSPLYPKLKDFLNILRYNQQHKLLSLNSITSELGLSIEDVKKYLPILISTYAADELVNHILTRYNYSITNYSSLKNELLNSILDNDHVTLDAFKDTIIEIERLEEISDTLLNHPVNPISPDVFLIATINASIIASDDESREKLTNIKIELVKKSLSKGANINNAFSPISSLNYQQIEFINKNKDIFLNNSSNSLSPDKLLKLAISYEDLWNSEKEIKEGLILFALEKGADTSIILNNWYKLDLSAINLIKDALLNHPTNPISSGTLLGWTVMSSSYKYDTITWESIIDKEKVETKKQIIEHLLEKGLDFNIVLKRILNISYSSEEVVLKELVEFLINNHEVDINQFFKEAYLELDGTNTFHKINDSLLTLLLDKGLNPNFALQYSLNTSSIEIAKLVIEGYKADISAVDINESSARDFFGSAFSSKNLKLIKDILLNNPAKPVSLEKLLEWTLNNSINKYDTVTSNFIIDEERLELRKQIIEYLLEKGIDVNITLKAILDKDAYDNDRKAALKELVEFLVNNHEIDINKFFKEAYLESHGHSYINPINKSILISFLDKGLNSDYALQHSLTVSSVEIAKLAIEEYNADPNTANIKQSSSFTFFELALLSQNFTLIDLLIEHGINVEISNFASAVIISHYQYDLPYIVDIATRFPDKINEDIIFKVARAKGASLADTLSTIDSFKLAKDFAAKKDLNEIELELLTPTPQVMTFEEASTHPAPAAMPNYSPLNYYNTINFVQENELQCKLLNDTEQYKNVHSKALTIEDYINAPLSNKYGYSVLHLALIGKKYKLAKEMIEAGFDIYKANNNNLTPLLIISEIYPYLEEIKELYKIVLEKIDNVDIVFDNGESLADHLFTNHELVSKVMEKTHDPLFYLMKNDSNLYSFENDISKTHIAISHGEGMWSTGVWSVARLVKNYHTDVEFHLVSRQNITEGGERFLKQFDAFINPGAGDSYPKLPEFKKEDCHFEYETEKLYQDVLAHTEKLNIPYLGMCAGAQHFAMYHGGTLAPLDGYNMGQHMVSYLEGTLPHFQVLTRAEQKKAVMECVLPKIKFKGDTAHHFAALPDKVGIGLQLGAVSEHGVPMSYAHTNGIRYATQFHPEHHYDKNTPSINYQKAWIDNFVHIAMMHHDARVSNGTHPIDYFVEISDRLNECLIAPTCINPHAFEKNGFSFFEYFSSE